MFVANFTLKIIMIELKYNKIYAVSHIPKVSIITSVYNRREILLRAMRSVAAQTFKDIEYIVVNNGSSIDIDDIILKFMEDADIPVVYIKRDNGIGPHTGKNSAFREARGKYLVMLDSDDELLPSAVEVLYNTWMSIPESERDQYREVVARCVDEYGNEIGNKFPDYINSCSKKQAFKLWHSLPGLAVEHVEMNVTDHLKKLMFPEPEGVTWVVDSTILWDRLSKDYRSYFINDCLKRYYTGSEDSITNTQINKVSTQHCVNMLFSTKFMLEHWNEYDYSLSDRVKRIIMYLVWKQVLLKKNAYPKYPWAQSRLKGPINILIQALLYFPSVIISNNYIKNKMQ